MGCDSVPVLEPGKTVLDLVAFAISNLVVFGRSLAALSRRYAWRDPFVLKGFAIPVCITPPIRQHVFGIRQTFKQHPCADAITTLARRQEHPQGAAQGIGDGVQLGIHPAFGAANQTATPPFFSPRLEVFGPTA
jgi:hypothetical protein